MDDWSGKPSCDRLLAVFYSPERDTGGLSVYLSWDAVHVLSFSLRLSLPSSGHWLDIARSQQAAGYGDGARS